MRDRSHFFPKVIMWRSAKINGQHRSDYDYKFVIYYTWDNVRNVRQWMKKHIKKGYATELLRYDWGLTVYIKNESAALLFKMAWSDQIIREQHIA